jgi:hypothetical protein
VKRKTFAAARFGVCANVFARSRIHFDPAGGAPRVVVLLDLAPARRTDCAGDAFRGDHASTPATPGAAPITLH